MDNVYRQARDDKQTPPETSDLPPVPEASDTQKMSPEARKKLYAPPETHSKFGNRPIGLLGGTVVILITVGYALLSSGMIPPIRDWYRPDHSQTLEQAYASGAPSVDQPWTFEEYRACQAYLESIDPKHYPRSGSKKSGKLFNHLLQTPTRMLDQAKRTGSEEDIRTAAETGPILSACSRLYFEALGKGEGKYGTELAHLGGANLHYARMLFALYDVPPERMDMIDQLTFSTLESTLKTFDEDVPFSDEDRQIIGKYLVADGPGLFRLLKPSSQKIIIALAEETKQGMTGDLGSKSVRSLLGQFIKQIKHIHATSAED